MIRGLFRLAAKMLFLCASFIFIAGFACVAFGSFMLTWPFVWGSPTRRRVRAGVELAGAIFGFMQTMRSPQDIEHIVDMMTAAQRATMGDPGDADPIRE